MVDFSKVIKSRDVNFDANKVIFDYQLSSEMYAVSVEYARPDDGLNRAEHEYDFGNYKDFGIDDNRLYRLWDYKERALYAVSPVTKRAFKCEYVRTGDHFDHSSRWALVDEVELTDRMKKSIEFYESDEVRVEVKKQWKEIVLAFVTDNYNNVKKHHEENLKVLEDLKVNHKRAFRKIANAEKDVESSAKSLEHYEQLIEKITNV